MNAIKTINTSHMTNAAHIGYMEQTIKRAKASEKVSADAAELITEMETCYAEEDECYVLSQKNEKTELILEADRKRDAYYMSYKKSVKSNLVMPDEDILTAAKKLWQHIKDHKIDIKVNMSEENASVGDLVKDLDDTLAEDVATLGLTKMVARLKEANETVKTLMYERNAEEATKVAGALRAARLKMDDAYKSFVTRLNALNVVQSDEAYDTFINEQNEQIDYYKQNVLKKSKTKKSTKETTSTTNKE